MVYDDGSVGHSGVDVVADRPSLHVEVPRDPGICIDTKINMDVNGKLVSNSIT
jgi:hypothetical protein